MITAEDPLLKTLLARLYLNGESYHHPELALLFYLITAQDHINFIIYFKK
jgi:hypothetical protein